MPLPIQVFEKVEPMQLDIPIEDNDSSEAVIPVNTEACNGDFNLAYKVENSTLDIEAYAANYNGINKIYRLLFVADHSISLRVEALKIALNYVKEHTHNTAMYSKIYFKLAEALEKQNENVESVIGPIDNQWIDQRNKRASNLLEKLETDLKCYKSNSIKESIRRGHDDLGDHYLCMGDLNNALKCYIRSRDYCTNNKHVLNMCLNTIRISIYLKNWSCVTSHVLKAENNSEFATSEAVKTKINCASGLANLANKKYYLAAKNFLQCNFDHFNNDSTEILSVNNIATYGTLCAMASFNRENLFRLVISSSSFKIFLETEPQLREALNKFYDSKYANCLSVLDELKDNFLLDLYLAPHIKVLYSSIRNRALIQYFSPYISAKMDKMALAFNTTVKSLEDEIMKLILDGQIQARIDSHNKVLYAKDIDPRTVTFEKALTIGKECQLRTKALLLRSAILKHGQIQVKTYSKNDENMMSN